MAFRFDKLTLKAQEAVARAQELAADRGHAQIDPLHLLAALLAEENDGIVGPILERIGVNRGQLDKIVQAELGHFAHVSGGAPPQLSQELNRVLEAAQREADAMKDEFVSTEHLLLALTKVDSKAKNVLKLNAITDKELLKVLQAVRGSTRVTDQTPGRQVPGAAALRHRPGRARPAGKARSGDRPRPGNPPRDAGPFPPHEEQPRADRRAGRGQDGHRRRAGPADRRRRRARKPEEQAGRSRSTWAPWWPARSFAASSRSG